MEAGYKLALYRAARPSVTPPMQVASTTVENQLRNLESQRDALNAALAANAKTIEDLNHRAKEWEEQKSALQADKTALEVKAQRANATSEEQARALSGERRPPASPCGRGAIPQEREAGIGFGAAGTAAGKTPHR
jgi:DNA repair exonuclease SbcCD ATPase subunit